LALIIQEGWLWLFITTFQLAFVHSLRQVCRNFALQLASWFVLLQI